jgi:hypothetical protein
MVRSIGGKHLVEDAARARYIDPGSLTKILKSTMLGGVVRLAAGIASA